MKHVKSYRIGILAICVLAALFFYKTFTTGLLPVPADSLVGLYHPYRDMYSQDYPRGVPYKNFLITDPVRQQIPWRKLAVDTMKSGHLPSWNPFSFSGSTLIGNIQAASLYPLNVLFLLLPFAYAWTVLVIIQPLLAGLFLFVYLQHKKLDTRASLLGAMIWMFSGFSIAWLTWNTILHVALWTPLVLYSIDKLIESEDVKRRIRWSFVLAVGMSMQFLAGHAQIFLYLMLAIGGYVFWQFRAMSKKKRRTFPWIHLISSSILMLTFTAIQWMPFVRFFAQTNRAGVSEQALGEGWFVPLVHVIQLIAPDFFGNPATLNYWGDWNYGEFVSFVGVVGVVFALSAILSKLRKSLMFWVICIMVVLIFAFDTQVSKIPWLIKIPLITSMQPTRLLVILELSLSILAAYGYNQWLKVRNLRSSITVVTIFLGMYWVFVFVGLWSGYFDAEHLLVSRRNLLLPSVTLVVLGVFSFIYEKKRVVSDKIVPVMLLLIASFELLRFGWKFTPFVQQSYFFPEIELAYQLQNVPEHFRIAVLDARALPANTGTYYGIEQVGGYDPVVLGRYEELIAAINRDKPDVSPPYGFDRIIRLENINSKLLPILNVRYMVSIDEIDHSDYMKVYEEGALKLYEYIDWSPRIRSVEKIVKTRGKDETIKMMFSDLYDPRAMAVVEGGDTKEQKVSSADINNLSTDIHTIGFTTNSDDKSYIVVSQTYDDGWNVYIDDKRVETYRTNYAFTGFYVPEGRHNIKMLYSPFGITL